MFDKTNLGKIKNSKILMWRLELRQFHYEIRHKPSVENVAFDAFSKICAALNTSNSLAALHASLGHLGYVRFYHFIRASNLHFTSDETKAVCSKCQVCAEIKPCFYRREPASLIKATNAWDRLSIDFKGPVKGPKPYLLVVIDEHSRFPFAFPSKKMTAEVVADCFSTLFSVFGFPTYIHRT